MVFWGCLYLLPLGRSLERKAGEVGFQEVYKLTIFVRFYENTRTFLYMYL